MKWLLMLLVAWVAFLVVRMFVSGATAVGVTRRDKPTAYWFIALAQVALIGFLIYVLMNGRA